MSNEPRTLVTLVRAAYCPGALAPLFDESKTGFVQLSGMHSDQYLAYSAVPQPHGVMVQRHSHERYRNQLDGRNVTLTITGYDSAFLEERVKEICCMTGIAFSDSVPERVRAFPQGSLEGIFPQLLENAGAFIETRRKK